MAAAVNGTLAGTWRYLLASIFRRMGSLYIFLNRFHSSFTLALTRAMAYAYAYARRMRGDVQGASCSSLRVSTQGKRSQTRQNSSFSRLGSQRTIKKSVVHLSGVNSGGKGHRLDRIVPFLH